MHPDFPYPLYLVISSADCLGKDLLQVAEQALKGGVDIIQLREKRLINADFLKLARKLKRITDRHNVPLIINDNVEVAREVEAFGVHVGNQDTPPSQVKENWASAACIGYSIEYIWQLEKQEAHIADYLGVSPVFSTPTKTDTVTEWGTEGLSSIRKASSKPLVAIGGINLTNIKKVVEAGADSIAVVSAICGAKDPGQAAFDLKNELIRQTPITGIT